MKILQLGRLHPPLPVGGVEKVIRNIYEELNATNHQCDVLTYNTGLHSSVDKRAQGTIYGSASLGRLNSVWIVPLLPLHLKRLAGGYDIIHAHHPDPMSALAIFIVRPKAKLVLHWHSDIIKQKITKYLFLPLQRWLLNRADAIIVTTPNYKRSNDLSEWQAKISVIPIGIATDELMADATQVKAIKQRYANRFIVLALGRLVYYKGFEYLVRAASYLDKSVVILIGGDGPYKSRLDSLIKKKKLQDKIVLLGRIDDEDLANYYQACDAFCLSSVARTEAFGIVQLEAMKFAKPIIATMIPNSGVSWVNADRITGINVKPKDSKALAEAISILQSHPTLAERFGKRGYRRFYDSFTRKQMCKNICRLYQSLVPKGT